MAWTFLDPTEETPLRTHVILAAACALAVAAAAAQAQTAAPPPANTAPPDKIDPVPVQPDASKPSAAAPAASAEDPLGVRSDVFVVRVAGPWKSEGRQGFSRVVGVNAGDRQRLYVQWLSEPDGAVVETKELVDEEAAKLAFGDVRAEPSDTGLSMFLDTAPDKDGLRDTWVLIVGEPGETRFGPATN
jgi:hypothetical protein